MGYAFLAFLIVFLLLGSGLALLFYRDELTQRLTTVLEPRTRPGFVERFKIRQTAESVGGFVESIRKTSVAGEEKTSALRQRLVLAGYRGDSDFHRFSVAKFVVPGLLCLTAAVTGLYHWNAFIVFAGAVGIGYLLPDYWLDHRIQARQNAIRRGLPDLLDLMVVCLEAGLSIDEATIRSSEELRSIHPAIADDMGLVMLEVRAGQRRMVAWNHLAERTNVEEVRMLATILVQADQFGTGVSRTLRVHSETMRTHRRQKLEELAAKTSVKLVFPLVFLIFPAFFVVALAPALIRLSEAFGRGQ